MNTVKDVSTKNLKNLANELNNVYLELKKNDENSQGRIFLELEACKIIKKVSFHVELCLPSIQKKIIADACQTPEERKNSSLFEPSMSFLVSKIARNLLFLRNELAQNASDDVNQTAKMATELRCSLRQCLKLAYHTPTQPSKNFSLVTPKLAGHVLSDTLLFETGLEGSSQRDGVHYLRNCLQQYIARGNGAATEQFQKFDDSLKYFDWVAASIEKICSIPPIVENNIIAAIFPVVMEELIQLANSIAQKVNSLNVGEQIIIPGGWNSLVGGHAMVYVIRRDTKAHFTFSCINSGAGISMHNSKIVDFRMKYTPALTMTNISLAKMTNPIFYQALLKLKLPYKSDGNEEAYEASNIYEKILQSLEGKIVEGNASSELITTQASGVCSWKSLVALMINQFGKKMVKPLILYIKQQTLIDYSKNLQQDSNLINIDNVQLLIKSAEGFSRYALASFEKSYCDAVQLKQICIDVANVLKIGKYLESNIHKERTFVSSSSKYWRFANIFEYFQGKKSYSLSHFDPPKNIVSTDSSIGSQNVDFHSSSSLFESPLITITALSPKLFLETLHGCIELLSKKGNSYDQSIFIRKMATKLILLTQNEQFWEDLKKTTSRDELILAMEAVEVLGDKYLQLVESLPRNEKGFLNQIAVSVNLFILMEKIAFSINPKDSCLYYFVVEPEKSDILKNQTRYKDRLLNPQLERKPLKLRFDKDKIKSLCSFKHVIIDDEENMSFKYSHENILSREGAFYTDTLRFSFDDNENFEGSGWTSSPAMEEIFRQFLNDPDFKEKILAVWPRLKNKSQKEIFMVLFSDLKSKVLPKEFTLLFKMYLRVQMHVQYPQICMPRQPADLENLWEFSIDSSSNGNMVSCKILLGGFDKPGSNIPAANFPTDVAQEQACTWGGEFLSNDMDLISERKNNRDLNSVFGRDYQAVSNSVAACYSPRYDLSWEEAFPMNFINTNNFIAIPQLLAYFKDNGAKLNKRDYQHFFLCSLFWNQQLKKMLQSSIDGQKVWDLFLNEGYKNAAHKSCWEEAFFYLYLSQLFPKNVTGRNCCEASIAKKAIASMGDSAEDRQTKAMMYGYLIIFHGKSPEITPQIAEEILYAYVYINVLGSFEQMAPGIQDEIKMTVRLAISKRNLNLLPNCEKLAQEFTHKKPIPNSKWILEDGWFSSVDLNVSISFIEGAIKYKNYLLGSLPTSIKSNRDYINLFKNKKLIAANINAQGFYECQYSSSSKSGESNNSLLQTIVINRLANGKLQIFSRYNGRLLQFSPMKYFKDKLPLQFLEGCFHWFEVNSHTNEPCFPLWIQNEEGLITAEVNYPHLLSTTLQIYRVHVGYPDNQALLYTFDPQSPLDSIFLRIDDQDHLFRWENKTIVLSRFNQFFHLDDRYVKWGGDEDYSLHENRTPLASLPYFTQFLRLVHKNGKSKILIPKGEFDSTKSKKGGITPEFYLKYPKSNASCFVFDVLGDGSLKGANVVENLYLAYLHLAQKNYEKAYFYIDQKQANPLYGYSLKELEMIKALAGLQTENLDKSPSAVALRLHVVAIFLRNKQQTESDAISIKEILGNENLSSLLEKYYGLLSNFELLALTTEQEILLLRCVQNESKLLSKRYAMLTEEKDDILEDHFSVNLNTAHPNNFRLEEWELVSIADSTSIKTGNGIQDISSRFYIESTYLALLVAATDTDPAISEDLQQLMILANGLPFLKRQIIFISQQDKAFKQKILRLFKEEIEPLLLLNPIEPEKGNTFWKNALKSIFRYSFIGTYTKTYILNAIGQFTAVNKKTLEGKTSAVPIRRYSSDEVYHPLNSLRVSDKVLRHLISGINELCAVRQELMEKETKKAADLPLTIDASSDEYTILKNEKIEIAHPKKTLTFIPILNLDALQHQTSIIQCLEKDHIIFSKELSSVTQRSNVLLKAIFKVKDESKIVAQELERIGREIEEYADSLQNFFYYTPQQSWEVIKENVGALSKAFDADLEILKYSALTLANKLPSDPVRSIKRVAALQGKLAAPFTLDELIILLMQKNVEKLKARNPSLTDNDINQLLVYVTDYLLQATRQQRLTRASSLIEEAGDIENSADKIEIYRQAAEELAAPELIAAREIEMLVISYFANVRLWSFQIDIIRSMTLKNGKAIENLISKLIMGSGKTKLIIPLLALLNSTGENIPMVVVPDSLFKTNSQDLKVFSAEFTGQEVETFFLMPNQELSMKVLKSLRAKLDAVKNHRSYMVTSPYSLHQLFLEQKILNEKCADIPLGQREISLVERRRTIVDEILELIETEGDALLDEADSILDMSKEVKSAKGKPSKLSVVAQKFTYQLFKVIFSHPKIAKAMEIDNSAESHFTLAEYHQTMKPELAKSLLDWLQQRYPDLKIDSHQVNHYIDYLCMDPSVEKVPDFGKAAAQEGFLELIGSIRIVLNSLLPFTAMQSPNKHYGLSRINTASLLCIPYDEISKLPQEGSEFFLPYVTMLCTPFYFCKVGVSPALIKAFVEELKKNALNEQRRLGIDIEETSAYKKFKNLGFDRSKNLFGLRKEDIDGICAQFNKYFLLRLEFACKFGLTQMNYQPESYTSNPLNFVDMFNSVQGFTGTLWNECSFSIKLKTRSTDCVDGKMISLLWQKNAQVLQIKHKTDKDKYDPIFSQLLAYHSLIDSGAWFKGFSNAKFAQLLMQYFKENNAPFEAVVYINDKATPEGTKGSFVALLAGRKTPIPLSRCTVPLEKQFTYYHIGTGLDKQQARHARGLITVDQHMKMRDNLQSVGRLRQFAANQKIDYAIREELKVLMDGGSLGSLLRFTAVLQGSRKEVDIECTLFKAISTRMRREILKAWKNSALSPQDKNSAYKALLPFLSEKNEKDFASQWAAINKDLDAKTVLNGMISSMAQSLERSVWNQYPLLLAILPIATLKERLNEEIEKREHLLPKTLKIQGSGQLGTSQKTQQQQETRVSLHLLQSERKTYVYWECAMSWDPSDKFSLFSETFFSIKNTNFIGGTPNSINHYLARYKSELQGVASPQNFFSPSLIATYAYSHIRRWGEDIDEDTMDLDIFGGGFKPITLCLMMQDFKSHQLKFYYLTPEEVGSVWQLLTADKMYDPLAANKEAQLSEESKHPTGLTNSLYYALMNKEDRSCRLALVQPEIGIVQQGSDRFKENIVDDPQYIALITESKFWNGDVYYSKREMEYLKEWLARVGPDEMENMLLRNILKHRPEAQRSYSGSGLEAMIKKARKKTSYA